MTRRKQLVDSFGRTKRAKQQVLGWSIDDETRTVTFFVPEHEEIGEFPSRLAGYKLELVALPRPHRLGEAL